MSQQSNWASLKKKLTPHQPSTSSSCTTASKRPNKNVNSDTRKDEIDRDKKKIKRTDINDTLRQQKEKEKERRRHEHKFSRIDKSKYVGLDCEMVGTGEDGKVSVLARACLVDFDGNVIYDEYVRPESFVTDFRTKYSGVRKKNLREGKAVSFQECINEVHSLMKGKIIVGHAVHNDLSVLHLQNIHQANIRDTARYKPYMRAKGSAGGKLKPRSLKELAKQFLGTIIQEGEHDPGVDARTAMELYKLRLVEWEQSLATNTVRRINGIGKMKHRDENGKKMIKPSVKAKKTKIRNQKATISASSGVP